jgi:hypothetical protein
VDLALLGRGGLPSRGSLKITVSVVQFRPWAPSKINKQIRKGRVVLGLARPCTLGLDQLFATHDARRQKGLAALQAAPSELHRASWRPSPPAIRSPPSSFRPSSTVFPLLGRAGLMPLTSFHRADTMH